MITKRHPFDKQLRDGREITIPLCSTFTPLTWIAIKLNWTAKEDPSRDYLPPPI